MAKIAMLFLIGILVMGMLGKLRIPGQKRLTAAKCSKCGRYKFTKGTCDCRAGKS